MASHSGRSSPSHCAEGAHARLGGLIQPAEILRQVELAGAPGNGAAQLDGVEEFGVADGLQEGRAGVQQLAAQAPEIGDDGLQARGIHARPRLELVQMGEVALQFLERIRTHVAAGGDGEDVQKAGHGRPGAGGGRDLALVQRLVVQKVQSHEGAHPLIERLLVHDDPSAASTAGSSICCWASLIPLLCLTRGLARQSAVADMQGFDLFAQLLQVAIVDG